MSSSPVSRVRGSALLCIAFAVLPACSGGGQGAQDDADISLDASTGDGDARGDGSNEPGDGDGDGSKAPGDGDGDGSNAPGDGDGSNNPGDGDGSNNPADGDGGAGDGDGDGSEPSAPGALTLTPNSGSYNAATSFSCVTVTGVEEGAAVHVELTTDGSEPAEPGPSSPQLTSDELCGVAQNGRTLIRIRQLRDGVAGPIVKADYVLDTIAPSISKVEHDASSVVYTDSTIHFLVQSSEVGGSASVALGSKTVTLFDDGTSGDRVAGDGIFERDYQVVEGDDQNAALVSAVVTDAAGNASTPAGASAALSIDTIGTAIGGKPFLESATWGAAGNPYMIDADAVFTRGASLTIEPGVHLVFRNGAELELRSAVSILGTEEAPVTAVGAGTIEVLPESAEVITYDAEGQYVAGPRFEHLYAPSLTLSFLYDVDNSRRPCAYIASTTLAALVSRYPDNWWGTISGPMYGTFIGHSRIERVVASYQGSTQYKVGWTSGRLEHSYFGLLTSYRFSSHDIKFCNIEQLDIAEFSAESSIEYNELGTLTWRNPRHNPRVHHNNFAPTVGEPAFVVTECGTASEDIDASENYWGPSITAQMQSLGASANLTAIEDFFDDFDQARVLYSGWLDAPVADAGPDW